MFAHAQLGLHDTLSMLCGSMHLTSALIMVKARKMNDGESETRPRKEGSRPLRPPSVSAHVRPTASSTVHKNCDPSAGIFLDTV